MWKYPVAFSILREIYRSNWQTWNQNMYITCMLRYYFPSLHRNDAQEEVKVQTNLDFWVFRLGAVRLKLNLDTNYKQKSKLKVDSKRGLSMATYFWKAGAHHD